MSFKQCILLVLRINHFYLFMPYFQGCFISSFPYSSHNSLPLYRWNVCVPPNSIVELLTPNVMVLGGGPLRGD